MPMPLLFAVSLLACQGISLDGPPRSGAPTDAAAPSDPSQAGDSNADAELLSQDVVRVSLPDLAHELRDLVCDADGDVSLRWRLDGQPWVGPTATTRLPGDTVPAQELRAGQVWTCQAPSTSAQVAVAPFHHPVVLDPVDAGPGDTVTLRYRGPLLDDDASGPVTLRLGFDGWSEQGDATPFVGTTSDGDPLYWNQLPLDADGTVAFTIPDDVASLRLAFDTDTVTSAEADEVLWGLDPVSMGPWLTVDPGGDLAVHFATTARGPATVSVTWEGGALQVQSDGADDLHHLSLAGVPADLPLTYTLTDVLGRGSRSWTTHRVDPAATDLTVLAAADMQDDGRPEQRWGHVAQQMLDTAPDADLLVLPGDLATNDHPGAWWLFFDRGGELFATVPMVIAVGNHDTPGRKSSPDITSVMRYFDLQGDGPGPDVGLVEYGPARVLLLNTEIEEELAPDGAQYRFADEALDRDSDASHTLVAFHRPAYDVGARFADEQHLFRDVTALFDGRADVVLMGHEHIFQRFQPLRYDARLAHTGRYGIGEGEGVAYMVLPAAGNNGLFDTVVGHAQDGGELRDLLATPQLSGNSRSVDQWHGFTELRIEGDRMEVVTWEVGADDTVPHEAFVVAP